MGMNFSSEEYLRQFDGRELPLLCAHSCSGCGGIPRLSKSVYDDARAGFSVACIGCNETPVVYGKTRKEALVLWNEWNYERSGITCNMRSVPSEVVETEE